MTTDVAVTEETQVQDDLAKLTEELRLANEELKQVQTNLATSKLKARTNDLDYAKLAVVQMTNAKIYVEIAAAFNQVYGGNASFLKLKDAHQELTDMISSYPIKVDSTS